MQNLQTGQYWQHHIAQWQSTDLSLAAYCRRQDLAYHQILYWKRKLEECKELIGKDSNPVKGFTRVVSSQVIQESISSEPSLTVTLPTGVTISGLNSRNVELLSAMLRQL